MSDAIMCDRCGEFEEVRFAPFDLDIEALAREVGGTIVLPDGSTAEWSREEEGVDLCSECAVEAIEWLDDFVEVGR